MTTGHLPDELFIDVMPLRQSAQIFRAINHPLRQEMLTLIHLHKRMTVTEIYVRLGLDQSPASQHLAILRKARLVKTEKQGKFIYYFLDYERIHSLHGIAAMLLVQPQPTANG